MMKFLLTILLSTSCLWVGAFAQNPIEKFHALNKNSYLLDQSDPISKPSFAYSLRKLKRSYSGYSLRIRRATDNAEADVAFDVTDIVSTTSMVTITAAGTSGMVVGSQMTLGTFKGAQQLFVKTWYDQGVKAYHASQPTASLQPELLFNTAGADNSKPSLSFNGSRYLMVGQQLQNLMNNGVNGTFLLALKVGSNTSRQYSFGHMASPNDKEWRWSLHLNWDGGGAYFDAAEPCCSSSERVFDNSSSINLWKQYTFLRSTTSKVARRSGTQVINDTSAPSTSRTGGDFWIGRVMNIPTETRNTGFVGNLTEAVMFPKDFSASQLGPVEFNQSSYWGL